MPHPTQWMHRPSYVTTHSNLFALIVKRCWLFMSRLVYQQFRCWLYLCVTCCISSFSTGDLADTNPPSFDSKRHASLADRGKEKQAVFSQAVHLFAIFSQAVHLFIGIRCCQEFIMPCGYKCNCYVNEHLLGEFPAKHRLYLCIHLLICIQFVQPYVCTAQIYTVPTQFRSERGQNAQFVNLYSVCPTLCMHSTDT